MGVHKFYGIFVKAIEGIILHEIPGLFGLIMDLNGFAHRCAQGIFGYGKTLDNMELTSEVKMQIRQMLKTPKGFEMLKFQYLSAIGPALTKIILDKLRPTDFLIMALDGKAPFAKGKQQLSRRTKSAIERNTIGPDGIPANEIFDTAYLTAGLPFMREVSQAIEKWIEANKSVLPHYTLYSGCDVEGEGEHKMFVMLEQVRNEMIHSYQGRTDKNIDEIFRNRPIGSYGLDADVGVLCAKNDYNFVWIREQFNINDIKDAISIDILRNYILANMTNGIDRSLLNRQHEMNIIDDFTLLTFLIGDDFVPAMFPLTINIKTTIDQMMYIYSQKVQQIGFLTTNGDINIGALTIIMQELVDVEKKMYKLRQDVEKVETQLMLEINNGQFSDESYNKVNNLRNANKIFGNNIKNIISEYYNSAPILSLSYEDYCEYWKKVLRRPCLFSNIIPTSHRIESIMYNSKEDLDNNSDEACQDYITGLRWNIAYYSELKVNNWFYKRSFPPTIHALAKFLKEGKYIMESVLRGQFDDVITTTQMLAMTLHPVLNADVVKSYFKTNYNYSNATINCKFLKVNAPLNIAYSYQGKYFSEEHSKIPLIPQVIFEDIQRVIPNPRLEVTEPNFFKIYLGSRPGMLGSIVEKKEKKKAHVSLGAFNSVLTIEARDEDANISSTIISTEMKDIKPKVRYSSPPKVPEVNIEETNKLDKFVNQRSVTTLGGRGDNSIRDVVNNRSGPGSFVNGRGNGGRGASGRGIGGRGTQIKPSNSMKVGRFRAIRTDQNYVKSEI